jgi:hypothetical protein
MVCDLVGSRACATGTAGLDAVVQAFSVSFPSFFLLENPKKGLKAVRAEEGKWGGKKKKK